MNAARIGIEWSRIFPVSTERVKVEVIEENGDILEIKITEKTIKELDLLSDKNAMQHYTNIFNDIKKRGWFLVINLFHWSLPLWINDPSNRNSEKDNALGNFYEKFPFVTF